MASNIDAIIADARQALRDSVAIDVTNDFTDNQMRTIIGDVVVDISSVSPLQAVETALVTYGSKMLDISEIDGLLEIDRVEYPVGGTPRNYHNFNVLDNETIEVDMGGAFGDTGSDGTLTGTVTFVSGSATVTGSGTDFDGELATEYFIKPSGASRWYRVFSITDDTTLVLEETVKSGDAGTDTINATQYRDYVARIYCNKVHTLTDETTTLNPKEIRVLVLGVVVRASYQWLNEGRNRLSGAIDRVDDINTAVDNMSARLTQAMADLSSGREYIVAKYDQAVASVDRMASEIETAVSDLTTGRSLIGDKRTESVAALAKIEAEIDQAVDDLDSGREQIDDERATALSAVDDVSPRIGQALSDLDSARSYINKINIGGKPQNDYGGTAARELQAANNSLQQANSYLNLSTTSSRYGEYAARDLQTARGYIEEARGYMALDQETSERSGYAARQLQTASSMLSQARGYIALSRPATEYGVYAGRELSNATAYLNQAGGYSREISSQINISRAITAMSNSIDRQNAEYRSALKTIVKRKITTTYSRS